MLLGAALVAGGVLASALADRVRGLRVSRDAAPRDRASRAQAAPSPVISVVEAAEAPVKPARVRAEPKSAAPKGGAGGLQEADRDRGDVGVWRGRAREHRRMDGGGASPLRAWRDVVSRKYIDSCVACGKIGHLARKIDVPGYTDPRDGSHWNYACPLAKDALPQKKRGVA